MATLDLHCLYSVKNGLLEGPRWDDREQALVFADARNGGVLKLDSDGKVHTVIAHRRGIGGMALHENGGCVVTGRNVAYKAYDKASQAQPTVVLIERDEANHRVGFNDLTTDARGRVYVGSMAFVALHEDIDDPKLRAGEFWVIDTDGAVRRVAQDIRVSNGTAMSADGGTLYLSDSSRRVVFSFPADVETGNLGERSVLIETPAGVPDGMAVAEDGSIWVTLAYAGKLILYSREGKPMQEFDIPDLMVTSVAFGGTDGRTLYVVTGAPNDQPQEAAKVYAARVDVAGIAVHRARTPTAAL